MNGGGSKILVGGRSSVKNKKPWESDTTQVVGGGGEGENNVECSEEMAGGKFTMLGGVWF